MAKKRSKISAVEEALSTSVESGWCIVDVENRFSFGENLYAIGDVKQYNVLNKPFRKDDGQYNDWTNESLMTQILAIDTGDEIRFFDESLTEIQSEQVKLV